MNKLKYIKYTKYIIYIFYNHPTRASVDGSKGQFSLELLGIDSSFDLFEVRIEDRERRQLIWSPFLVTQSNPDEIEQGQDEEDSSELFQNSYSL